MVDRGGRPRGQQRNSTGRVARGEVTRPRVAREVARSVHADVGPRGRGGSLRRTWTTPRLRTTSLPSRSSRSAQRSSSGTSRSCSSVSSRRQPTPSSSRTSRLQAPTPSAPRRSPTPPRPARSSASSTRSSWASAGTRFPFRVRRGPICCRGVRSRVATEACEKGRRRLQLHHRWGRARIRQASCPYQRVNSWAPRPHAAVWLPSLGCPLGRSLPRLPMG